MSVTDVQTLIAELSEWVAARGVAPETHRYGPGPDHEADLLLPGGKGPHRLAILLHGGFWRARFTRSIMDALAIDLADRGWATWNVEYRRTGTGGGAVQTLADVRQAIDALTDLNEQLEPDRVIAIGHSAGGQLALCAASNPTVDAVVSLAGVCDMARAAEQGIGDNAVLEFLGVTPHERPDVYELADPMQRLPTGTPVLLVHGDADDRVPVALSRDYAVAAAAAGDDCELLELAGVDHFALIDPRTAVWSTIADRLPDLAG